MRKLIFIGMYLLCGSGFGQTSIKDLLNKFNDHSVPYIYVDELTKLKTPHLLLDTREKEEYDISHLEHAIQVGFKGFKVSKIASLPPDKDAMIVVYCSVGIRSEIIGKKLLAKGYTAVYNLYGGIFEWTNKGGKVYRNQEETPKVHAHSKPWGSYLLKGTIVYE
ncbi:rhodanese-like domain-containing protein [Flavobacteriaceae bacterium]|nr:rhodanese-like domain-containing protein [Flavobacteriaceae bacterium]